ncbi:MAG: sporulation transcriptional regulator SpoIIID [Christensenellales bacterium]
MKDYIEERVYDIANYILETGATVRQVAQVFKYSKSTVHKDVSERLPQLNKSLAVQVRAVLEKNKAERHIRGGQATLKKYSEAANKRFC